MKLSARGGWRSCFSSLFLVFASFGIHAQIDLEEVLMHPHRDQSVRPPGFDVTFEVDHLEGDCWLLATVHMPYGGYVISALSDFDYLGKFQVLWENPFLTQIQEISENPPSELGLEPFDYVMVPMLLRTTQVGVKLAIRPGITQLVGEVFFVLEPQCMPYRWPFEMEKINGQWTVHALEAMID